MVAPLPEPLEFEGGEKALPGLSAVGGLRGRRSPLSGMSGDGRKPIRLYPLRRWGDFFEKIADAFEVGAPADLGEIVVSRAADGFEDLRLWRDFE